MTDCQLHPTDVTHSGVKVLKPHLLPSALHMGSVELTSSDVHMRTRVEGGQNAATWSQSGRNHRDVPKDRCSLSLEEGGGGAFGRASFCGFGGGGLNLFVFSFPIWSQIGCVRNEVCVKG